MMEFTKENYTILLNGDSVLLDLDDDFEGIWLEGIEDIDFTINSLSTIRQEILNETQVSTQTTEEK